MRATVVKAVRIGNVELSGSVNLDGSLYDSDELVVPADSNAQFNVAFEAGGLYLLFVQVTGTGDTAITIKTNDLEEADDELHVDSVEPFLWNKRDVALDVDPPDGFAVPITTDVTSIFVLNSHPTNEATVRIVAGNNPNPA